MDHTSPRGKCAQLLACASCTTPMPGRSDPLSESAHVVPIFMHLNPHQCRALVGGERRRPPEVAGKLLAHHRLSPRRAPIQKDFELELLLLLGNEGDGAHSLLSVKRPGRVKGKLQEDTCHPERRTFDALALRKVAQGGDALLQRPCVRVANLPCKAPLLHLEP